MSSIFSKIFDSHYLTFVLGKFSTESLSQQLFSPLLSKFGLVVTIRKADLDGTCAITSATTLHYRITLLLPDLSKAFYFCRQRAVKYLILHFRERWQFLVQPICIFSVFVKSHFISGCIFFVNSAHCKKRDISKRNWLKKLFNAVE